MKRKNLYCHKVSMRMAALVALLLLTGSIFGVSASQEEKSQANSEPTGAENQVATVGVDEPHATDGNLEGVKVHGHWTIEVRDPDGTLVERREFDNALVATGQTALAQVLARTLALGRWTIAVDGSTSPCTTTCFIVESNDPQLSPLDPNEFGTLTVTQADVNGTPTLILNGSATANSDGIIDVVDTLNTLCDATVLASGGGSPCEAITSYDVDTGITSTGLTTSVNVLNGQQVQVTVEIQFS